MWSFANFGRMVKQRVGERDWFVRHPGAFQKSAHLNFYFLVAFAVLLFLAGILMLFMPTNAMNIIEAYLDLGFDDQPDRAFFLLHSEWLGTHCTLEENREDQSCKEQSLEDWTNWFFVSHFSVAGICTLGLCAMATVWAYCVKQLHDHADDPAWQQAISGKRLYAGKVQRIELDSILAAEAHDDALDGVAAGMQRSDAASGVQ